MLFYNLQALSESVSTTIFAGNICIGRAQPAIFAPRVFAAIIIQEISLLKVDGT